MADEDASLTTCLPLRALKKGLYFYKTLMRSAILWSIFISLTLMRMIDAALVYIMEHWSTSMIFQSWTLLVLCSYTVTLPAGIIRSQLFLQLEALVWLLRTVDLMWTLPKTAIRASLYLLKLCDKDRSTVRVKWRPLRDPSKSPANLWQVFPTSFQGVKQGVYILLGLYWCMFMPIARAGPTACPMYTANMGPGRWVHFYAAFRAYLIRKDIFVFDEKNPDDLLTSYPADDDTVKKQELADLGVTSKPALKLACLKGKAFFEEAMAGFAPGAIVAAKALTYAEAVVNVKEMLMGEREESILLHRTQIGQAFRSMVTSPHKLAEHWVTIQEGLDALE
jgi:hypothetical protein